MRHQRLRLAAGLLTFLVGASLAHYARRPAGPDCFCATARCRVTFVIDHPSTSLQHPLETAELLWAARWLD
jgi:hypothetical protein